MEDASIFSPTKAEGALPQIMLLDGPSKPKDTKRQGQAPESVCPLVPSQCGYTEGVRSTEKMEAVHSDSYP